MYEYFRDVNNIEILKIALHVVNNRDEELILSDMEIDIESLSDKLMDWINKHILKSLKEEKSRLAKFSNPNTFVQKFTDEIMDNPDENFLDRSQKISQLLYHSMRGNKKIAPGDLLVILYKDTDRDINSIALLKMDYNDTVTRKIITDDKTEYKKIQLVINGESFPNLRQKLQKVAFIIDKKAHGDSENVAELVLLDRQQGEDGDVANFFKDDFLACNLLLTDDNKTVELYKNTSKWINTQPKSEITKKLLNSTVHLINSENNINIFNLANSVFGDDEEIKGNNELFKLKKSYTDNMLTNIGDPDFKATNSKALIRMLNNKKIKTTDNIEIIGPVGLFEDKIEYINEQTNEKGEIVCDIIIRGVTIL